MNRLSLINSMANSRHPQGRSKYSVFFKLMELIMATVMRRPCLMEDEGRHFYVKSFSTYEEAQCWIISQKGQYFGPSDYYIAV